MFGPDDDEDFTPAGNSKLASLFGRPIEEGNSSLTYTAPKQPKKIRPETGIQSSPTPDPSSKLSLILVQAVQLYKLEDGNYINQGRVGAALLGNITTKVFQLLLYKTREQHITAARLTNSFQFIVQAKNFASFYDDRGQNWSIMFDTESAAVDFAREVGLARSCALSEKEDPSFYVQDLKVGEGISAEMGDLLEIRYTTSPVVNGKLEKAIETNFDAEKPQRVKIRKGVWEEALLNATKGCKKFIILAPILFGPWKPLADPNNRLAVEVEIGRIKACRRSRESTPVDILRHSESPESNVDSSTDETSIKARGASISEALTNSPKTNKASIISRMARMGQATLPLKGAIVCNPSDSEETEEESSSVTVKASNTAKSGQKSRGLSGKRSSHASSSGPVSQDETESNIGNVNSVTGNVQLPAQQVSIFQTPPVAWHQPQFQQSQIHPQQYMINGVPFAAHSDAQLYAASHQVVSVPTVVSTPGGTPSESLSVYFSENRTHNTEVRMGLAKVADKVDQILEKVDTLNQPSVGVIDPKTLLASIQKLVVENEQLKVELSEKRIKLEQQNEKMYQLLQHKFLEQSSASSSWDQRQDPTFQSVVMGLQQEKAKLAAELSETVSKTNAIQVQATKFERVTIELQEEINKLTARLQGAYLEMEHEKQTIRDQENIIRSLKEKTDASANVYGSQDTIVNDLKVHINELQVSKAQLQAALDESKSQQELSAKRNLEEISALQAAHIKEIEKLKSYYEGELKSFSKEENKGSEESYQFQQEVEDQKKRIIDFESEVASLKNQLKVAQNTAIDDLKRVMNVMFKHLKTQFIPENSYNGSDIRDIILTAIQNITMEFVSMKTGVSTKTSRKENIKQITEKDYSSVVKSIGVNASTDKIESKTSNKVVEVVDVNQSKENKMDNEEKKCAESKAEDNIAIEKTETEKKEIPGKEPLNNTHNNMKMGEDETPLEAQENPDNSKPKSQETDESVKSTEKSRDPSIERGWKPQPPPPPLFDDEEDDDDWLS